MIVRFADYWWNCWASMCKFSFHSTRLRNQCRSLEYRCGISTENAEHRKVEYITKKQKCVIYYSVTTLSILCNIIRFSLQHIYIL